MLPRFSLAVMFGVLLNTTAFAASHGPQQCGNLNPASDGDADRAFQCITDLELKIDALAALVASQTGLINTLTTDLKNTIPAVADDANTRSVIAFTADKGEKTCPPGWEPFEPAKDRFIVGAGGEYPVFSIANPLGNSTGGAETVTLTKAQMPDVELSGKETLELPLLASLESFQANRGNTLSTEFGIDGRTSGFRYASGAAISSSATKITSLTFKFSTSTKDLVTSIDWPGESQPHPNMPPYIALVYCQKV